MASRPPVLAALPASALVHLDVRDDIRRDREPFPRIMAAVKALGEGQVLVLRVPFEPLPLYTVLGKRGFGHWAERHADGDWSVWFYRDPAAPAAPRAPTLAASPALAPSPARAAAPGDRPTRTIDVRGLEPPQPMVRILEALEAMAPGDRLEVLHERRPMLLYPQLDERGFAHETDEPAPGLVRIVIRRTGGSG